MGVPLQHQDYEPCLRTKDLRQGDPAMQTMRGLTQRVAVMKRVWKLLPRPVSHSSSFACRLKDNATPYLYGVVREAFVEPAQQGDIHGCCDAMLPLRIHQDTEQLLVKLIHRIVLPADLSGLLRITR
jgi:hypothetical protein